jgi:hypothetical protein
VKTIWEWRGAFCVGILIFTGGTLAFHSLAAYTWEASLLHAFIGMVLFVGGALIGSDTGERKPNVHRPHLLGETPPRQRSMQLWK